MRSLHDPFELSPEQRRHELGEILAIGVLRLGNHRLRAQESAESVPETPEETAAKGLEVPEETVLSVHTG